MEKSADFSNRQPVKRTREIALSAAWHGGLTRSLVDTEGRLLNVVFPGHWSHGFGPDFTDAMIEMPGRGLVTGSVELHHDASDWRQHGHHLDLRYNDVILHVVSRPDVVETNCLNGTSVPMAVLTVPEEMLFRIDSRLPEIWADLGGEICAEDLARAQPQAIIEELDRLGDIRLHDRVTRIEGDLHVESARDVLTTLLFDALGYSENRQPMQLLARQLNRSNWSRRLATLPTPERLVASSAMVFGIAGYLPLSPGDAHLAGIGPSSARAIEDCWQHLVTQLDAELLGATSWVRTRTRPANHPAARLAVASLLLARWCDDPVGEVLRATLDSLDLTNWLLQLCSEQGHAALGEMRARTIVANVLLPFAIAIGRNTGDFQLEEVASSRWQQLGASERSRPIKRALHQVAGSVTLRNLGERGQQGLLKLDRDFCTPRRCFECPIASSVVHHQITSQR